MKREITYYMLPEYPVTIIEDTEEGGFTITLPDCPGCVTCCERWKDIPATIEDAQKAWMEAVMEDANLPREQQERSLSYYMDLDYNIDVISRDENGYTVGIRELPWITAHNKSMDTALELLSCNKDSWLQDAIEDGVPIPEPPREDKYDLPAEIAAAIERQNYYLNKAEKNAKKVKNFFCDIIISSNDTAHSVGMDMRQTSYATTKIPQGKYIGYDKNELQDLYKKIINVIEGKQ